MKICYKLLLPFLIYFYIANKALAEVKIENVIPPITENVAPIPDTNINSPIADINQDKTVINSKVDLSSMQIYQEPKSNKSNINNFAIGTAIGKKIKINKLHFFSPNFENFFEDKFLLAELFYNKNIIKNSFKNNLNIDSLYGFRSGFGKDFGDVHLILNSAFSLLNISTLGGDNKRNFLFLLGLTSGYELNKNFDIRLNIMTSAFRNNSNLNQIFNNFDLSIGFNF